MAEEKIAYFYGDRPMGLLARSYSVNITTVVGGEIKSSGGGHIDIVESTIIEKYVRRGYRIVLDQDHEGKSIPLSEEVKSRLQKALEQ